MAPYYLVIDTETSSLPKNWDAPYSEEKNWPHVLQIAWLVFDEDGKFVKQENYFLKPGNFKITKASTKVHKITTAFLTENGTERLEVFEKLNHDVNIFKPLIIAHFIELDFKMVGAELYRLALPNPITQQSLFCTLKASAKYVKNPSFKFLKLNVFYKTLFKKRPENLHNALVDAALTAEIFFHLKNKGEVNQQIIEQHTNSVKRLTDDTTQFKPAVLIAFIIVLIVTMAIYFYGK